MYDVLRVKQGDVFCVVGIMAENKDGKPNVIILGGVGFIGRNLVHYLVENDLINKIRVVDKVMPAMAWLSNKHKESFKRVEFKHANLINPRSVTNAFSTPDGTTFDFVINCASETKMGQSEAVYHDGVYKLSCNCAEEAGRHKVRRYIEMSTTQFGSSDKKPQTEVDKAEPWSLHAKYKLAVEDQLPHIPDLNFIIVRPVIVYGPSDRTGLTPRLVAGGIYRYLGEKMKLLWTKDLKMNTVHVHDVARALWHLCYHGNSGDIYNLADQGDTTQGKIADIISDMFDISHEYIGTLASKMANLSIDEVIQDINDKHMTPWGEACQKDGISNTPITPYIREDVLMHRHQFVNGTRILKTGFTYDHPTLTKDLLKEVLDDFIAMNLYPPSLIKGT
ncbi:hypothetical protein LSH36_13g22038 [Paralvinella palmiformis]|uniref:NAD-dependent epimerase/dehydratase domain-containing protein n=1 Tax=Paralvinella palmiformis TaxID=53620 RepID=A0AAD9NHY7_9ANNE|nr:hypothetical protein LSH36_13g22038 [Paralvinella palmiformis]